MGEILCLKSFRGWGSRHQPLCTILARVLLLLLLSSLVDSLPFRPSRRDVGKHKVVVGFLTLDAPYRDVGHQPQVCLVCAGVCACVMPPYLLYPEGASDDASNKCRRFLFMRYHACITRSLCIIP